MDVNNVQHWEELLINLCKPVTEIVRNATEVIQGCIQHPSCFLMLFQLINTSSHEEVRHLAAVLCRRVVSSFWKSTPEHLQNEVKKISLEIISNVETPKVIKKSVSDIIARIINVSPVWPGFLEHLNQLVNSKDPSQRDIGIYLFQTVLDSEPLTETYVLPHIDGILHVIQNGLQDPNPEVRIRALGCANSFLLRQQEQNIHELLSLMPKMIDVINYCIEDCDDRVSIGFEILSTLTEDYMKYLKPMVPDLLRFTLTVGANSSLDVSLRQHALYFIEFIISNKPKSFLENVSLQDVVALSFRLMTEEVEDEEESASKYGSQIIDVLAIQIPAKYVWQPIMDMVLRHIQSPRSIDRKAAINAISVISEGCADNVADHIGTIMPWILAGLKAESDVRQASLVAISEMAKNLSESIAPYHEEIIPLLLAATKDPINMICIKAYYAISYYMVCEPETLLPHLELLLNHLMPGLDHKNQEVKELALNALSASISVANEKFDPYFAQTIAIMKNWMTISNPDSLVIRGRATECVAMLAGAVSRDIFLPHFTEVVNLALKGLGDVDNAELREFIYRFFEQLAREYADELSFAYPVLMPYMLASCESSEGLVYINDDESFKILPEESLETAIGQEVTLKVLSSYMDEKAAAASCLGWLIAENCDASASYIESSFNVLAGLTIFDLYPPVASAAIIALIQVLEGMIALTCENFEWKKGEKTPLPSEATNGIQILFDKYEQIMLLPEYAIVRSAIESMGKLSLVFGPSSVLDYMPKITEWMASILQRRAKFQLCQESFDESEEDFVTFSVVLDVMVEFSKSCFTLFVPFLPLLFNCFSPYLGEDVPSEYKDCIFSCVSDIAKELEFHFQPFAAPFWPICLREITPASDDIQYACSCLRKLIQYGNVDAGNLLSVFPLLLDFLKTSPSSLSEIFKIESILGVCCEILLLVPDAQRYEAVFPVLSQCLPLRANTEPSSTIYTCILKYISHPMTINAIPLLLELAASELLQYNINKETQSLLTQFLLSHGDKLESVFARVRESSAESAQELQNILAAASQ